MNERMMKELLDRGLSDMLQLGVIAWVVKRGLAELSSQDEIVRATTEVVGELVSFG
jgi:hypothetical protein